MRSAALTPALALRHLGRWSRDIRAAIFLDSGGALAAAAPEDEDLGERLRDLTLALLEEAGDADGAPAAEVEVTTPAGAVYVVRDRVGAVAVVAGRLSLSSLMRYDLRRTLTDLEGGSR